MLVSNFLPSIAPPLARPLTQPQAALSEPRNAASWFDDTPAAGLRIGVELGTEGRGLSVAQHAQRVLGHLLGEG